MNDMRGFAREGLYGMIRHPQIFPVIVLVYVRLARKEEKDMIDRFGAEVFPALA